MARYDWPASPVSEDDAGGRQNYRAALRPAANVRFDDGSLAATPKLPKSRKARSLPKAPPSGGQDLWLPIGPTTVISGQASGRPDISGRIRDLAVEPNVGNRVYAAAAGGGVWFSPDAGSSWRPLDGFVVSPNRTTVTPVGSALSCGAIYVHFGVAATGADDEVYVGTGEPSSQSPGGNPGGNLVGVGILHARGPATGIGWVVDPTSTPFIGHYIWRIVASPLDPEHLFAATSAGLFHRPPGRDWANLGPLPAEPLDVLVTQRSATEVRIWVNTFSRLYFATLTVPVAAGPMPTVTYTVVTLPTVLDPTRKVLALGAANELWVLGRAIRPDPKSIDPAFLWKVDPTAATPAGIAITGVPKDLFGATHDQSRYDICLAVHPENTSQLFVGGSGLSTHGEWNAGLYSLTVSGTTADPTLLGVGVHADVHIIRVGPRVTSAQPPHSVWIGCDGGVFRSANDGNAGSFVTRNFELATLEPGYVACHPTNEGIVAVGMQDNGTCERRGDVVWELTHKGDGGGTVYDPSHEHRFFRQYIRADWESSDGEGTPVVSRHYDSSENSSETIEGKASLFYSGASALAHGGTTHLLLGTDRPWYSANWGRNWVTVPTGTDPRATNNANLGQDLINPGTATGQYTDSVPTFLCCHGDVSGSSQTGSAVITARLSAADSGATVRVRAHLLWGKGVSMYLGTKPATDGAPWTWALEVVEPIRFNSTADELNKIVNGDPTTFVPAPDRVTDIAVHEPGRGTHGSCYVATIGGAAHDTLYWYDGTGTWYPCGVRKVLTRGTWTGDRIGAPAMAVVVDPVNTNVVFVGTSIGVIRGELSMVDHGAGPVPEWAWKPFDNGLPESAVNDLSIFSDGTVRLLRAGLHGRGVWEVDLVTVVAQPRTILRVYPTDSRRRPSTPISGPPTHGEAAANLRFDASPDIVVDVTALVDDVGGPTEATLFRRMIDLHAGDQASLRVSPRTFKIHVLVHHRWPFEAMPPQLKVALLRRDLAAGVTDPALDGIFQTMVDVAGGAAVPASLPGAWVKAGTQLIDSIGSPTDARKPRAATFNIDLTGHADGRVLFMAVVMSDADQIAASEMIKPDTSVCINVSDLVLNSRHVAARSVELT